MTRADYIQHVKQQELMEEQERLNEEQAEIEPPKQMAPQTCEMGVQVSPPPIDMGTAMTPPASSEAPRTSQASQQIQYET